MRLPATSGWRGYRRRFTLGLAAVLWRHLAGHEPCLARGSKVASVHAGHDRAIEQPRPRRRPPLDDLVGLVGSLAGRYERLLRRSEAPAAPHEFSSGKYEPLRELTGHAVLLIDDTWTKGANAQSAAAVLKAAGAKTVAAVVIGRYVNRGWRQNDRHLRSLTQPFDWQRCALCAPSQEGSEADGLPAPTGDPSATVTSPRHGGNSAVSSFR